MMDCSLCQLPTRVYETGIEDGDRDTESDGSGSDASQYSRPRGRSNRSTLNTATELYPQLHPPRDVSKTVSMQLIAAINKRETHEDREQVKQAQDYLRRHSAKSYPPSLAAFPGMGSPPFCLYRAISFDRLHVLDIGIIREIHDHMYTISTRQHLPCARFIGLLNDRYMDLASRNGLRRVRIFRENATTKQAGMTGLIRRQSLPFLWLCVIGLTDPDPDNDMVLQCLLKLNRVYYEICGWSVPLTTEQWSEEHLVSIQERCFSIGVQISSIFQLPVNTKLHRFMRHVKTHFMDFGDVFTTSTEENERMHKESKSVYHCTNKRPAELAAQILKRRMNYAEYEHTNIDVESSEEEQDTGSEAPVADEQQHIHHNGTAHLYQASRTTGVGYTWDMLFTHLSRYVEGWSGHVTPTILVGKILTSVLRADNTKIWKTQSRLQVKLGSMNSEHVRKCIMRNIRPCAADGERWTFTHGIQYRHRDSVCIGILTSIFTMRRRVDCPGHRALLIAPLVPAASDDNKKYVSTQFGHIRMKIRTYPDEIRLFVKQIRCGSGSGRPKNFDCSKTIVVDPMWASHRYTLSFKTEDIPNSSEVRKVIRFILLMTTLYNRENLQTFIPHVSA